MNKIKQIKKLETTWKAAETNALTNSKVNDLNYASGVLFGLDAALEIINQPSNQVNATCPCGKDQYFYHGSDCNICANCNKPINTQR